MKKLVYMGIFLLVLLPFQNCSKTADSGSLDPALVDGGDDGGGGKTGNSEEERVEAHFYDDSGNSVFSLDDGNSFGREVVYNVGPNTLGCLTDTRNLSACSGNSNFVKLSESRDFMPSGNVWTYSEAKKSWSLIFTINDLAAFSDDTYVHYFLDPDKEKEANERSSALSIEIVELSNDVKLYDHRGVESVDLDHTKMIRHVISNAGPDVKGCGVIPNGDSNRCSGSANDANRVFLRGTGYGPSSMWIYNESTRTWSVDVAPEDIKGLDLGDYVFMYWDKDKKDPNNRYSEIEFALK